MRSSDPKKPAASPSRSRTKGNTAALARPGGGRGDHFTYRVTWAAEDDEHVGLCVEFPSLSWLAKTPEGALKGIRTLVAEVTADMQAQGEAVPVPLAARQYSGEFRVRIPPRPSPCVGHASGRAGREPEPARERQAGDRLRAPT